MQPSCGLSLPITVPEEASREFNTLFNTWYRRLAGPGTGLAQRGGFDQDVPKDWDGARIALQIGVSDRVYVLSGAVSVPSEMMSLHLAGALAHAIDLANTVE